MRESERTHGPARGVAQMVENDFPDLGRQLGHATIGFEVKLASFEQPFGCTFDKRNQAGAQSHHGGHAFAFGREMKLVQCWQQRAQLAVLDAALGQPLQ